MNPRRGRARRPGGVGEEIRRRHEWLELLQTSGPFLTLPVVHRAFPDGLPPVPQPDRAKVRALVAGLLGKGASRRSAIETTLRDVLDWKGHLRIDTDLPDSLAEPVAEHGICVRPDFGFYEEDAAGGQDGDDEPCDEQTDDEDAGGEPGEEHDARAAAGAAGGRGPW